MGYRIRFRSRAKAELSRASDYGIGFTDDLHQWLECIADACGTKGNFFSGTASVDLAEFLGEVAGQLSASDRRRSIFDKWLSVNNTEKALALLTAIRRRGMPYDFRVSMKWIRVLEVFDREIHAYYEINHVKREIVFVKFYGLPGEDC